MVDIWGMWGREGGMLCKWVVGNGLFVIIWVGYGRWRKVYVVILWNRKL